MAFLEGGILYIIYDGPDGINESTTKWVSSSDYGKTYTKLGVFGIGLVIRGGGGSGH